MNVGEVVNRSGTSRKALRLYEARGILPPPRRSASGYRVYADEVFTLLSLVQQCRRLGLTLAEIKHIIGLRRSGAAPCAHVRRLLMQKEADLTALLTEVRNILKAWPITDGLHAAICPHIEARGGDLIWKGTRFAPRAPHARKSSSTAIKSAVGEDANTVVLRKEEWNVLVELIQSGQLSKRQCLELQRRDLHTALDQLPARV